jgi:hypothetical protein
MCEVLWRNISNFYVNLRVEVGKHPNTVSVSRYSRPITVTHFSMFHQFLFLIMLFNNETDYIFRFYNETDFIFRFYNETDYIFRFYIETDLIKFVSGFPQVGDFLRELWFLSYY